MPLFSTVFTRQYISGINSRVACYTTIHSLSVMQTFQQCDNYRMLESNQMRGQNKDYISKLIHCFDLFRCDIFRLQYKKKGKKMETAGWWRMSSWSGEEYGNMGYQSFCAINTDYYSEHFLEQSIRMHPCCDRQSVIVRVVIAVTLLLVTIAK